MAQKITGTTTGTGILNGFQPVEPNHLYLYDDPVTSMDQIVLALLVIWDIITPEEANQDEETQLLTLFQASTESPGFVEKASEVMLTAHNNGVTMVPILKNGTFKNECTLDEGLYLKSKVSYLTTAKWTVGKKPQ